MRTTLPASGPKTVAGGNEHAQAHGLDAGDEGLVVLAVALPTRFQTFLGDHGEAFAQGVEHGGGCRVVILTPGVERVEKLQVEIEGLDRRLARLEALQGARRDGDRRQAGRAAEPFLGATVGEVDAVFVDHHRHAAQRGHAIGNGQRVDFVGRFADRLRLVVESGGSLGLYEGDHARAFAADEVAGLLRVKGLAPGLGEADDFAAVAAGHFADAVTEETVGEESERFAGLDEVGHGGFHAGAAGARDGDVALVLGGIGVAEQAAYLFDYLEEERVEMADHGLRHGLVDAGRDHAGSRSEQKALRRLEGSIRLRHQVQFSSAMRPCKEAFPHEWGHGSLEGCSTQPCRRSSACAAPASGTGSPSAPPARPETRASWEPPASGAFARIPGSFARADRWPSRNLSRISSRSPPVPPRLSEIP